MYVTIHKALDRLSGILNKETIDWPLFDEELSKLEDINVLDEEYEETILSEIIHDERFWRNGRLLPKVIKHFLANGYDVLANGGRNGIFVLSQLCWASYDKYILDAAKVLLDAGAIVESQPTNEDEDEGVLGSISWKISGAYMADRDYTLANVFIAYYDIIKAYQEGKDYNSIESFHKCIGKTVTKVTAIGGKSCLKRKGDITEFYDKFIVWFGDIPLVVSNYIEFVVNPVFAEDNKNKIIDVSAYFEGIIGSKLENVRFIDEITCYFDFDNGHRLLFSNYESDERKRKGLYEIRSIDNYKISTLKINEICRLKGKTYSSQAVEYDEPALALFCDTGTYLIFPVECEDVGHSIGIIGCSKELVPEYVRKFPLSTIEEIREFEKNDKVVGLRLKCREGYLHLKTNEYYELKIMLLPTPFDPNEYLSLLAIQGKGIHMDFPLRKIANTLE